MDGSQRGTEVRCYFIPLLNAVEALQERNGNRDDDGFLALAHLDLEDVC